MDDKNYGWKRSSQFSADMVGREFEAIERRDGKLTNRAIVEAARPVDAPMHSMFEWDDRIVGELYRRNQAGFYVRNLTVEIVPAGARNGKAVETRAYVNVTPVNQRMVENEGAFVSAARAVGDPGTYAIVLQWAKRELRMFREKYKSYKELGPVFEVIDQIAMEV